MPILNHLLALTLLTASASLAAVQQPAVIDRKQADEGTFAGDLWIVELETRAARRITRTGGYRSPIFLAGDRKLLALKGEELIEIPVEGGEPNRLYTIKGIVKLIGAQAGDQNLLLLLSGNQEWPSAELLSLKSGRRMVLNFNSEPDGGSKMLGYLRGWERTYDNGTTNLYTKPETKAGPAGDNIEWRDVYLKKGDREPVNLSNCNGTNCGQPSLSSNAREVVYIKSDK